MLTHKTLTVTHTVHTQSTHMTNTNTVTISFDKGNTDHTMMGTVTTHKSGNISLCGEFNGQGFNLLVNPNTGEVELDQ